MEVRSIGKGSSCSCSNLRLLIEQTSDLVLWASPAPALGSLKIGKQHSSSTAHSLTMSWFKVFVLVLGHTQLGLGSPPGCVQE